MEVWTIITRMFGAAIRARVGMRGASSRRRVRMSISNRSRMPLVGVGPISAVGRRQGAGIRRDTDIGAQQSDVCFEPGDASVVDLALGHGHRGFKVSEPVPEA